MKTIIDLTIVLLTAWLCFFSGCQGQFSLVIEGENRSEAIQVGDGDEVEISYIHSVEKFRCREIFRVTPEGLVLTETLTKSTGWGLPSNEENFSFKDFEGERWLAFKMQRPVKCLVISPDPINDYSLRAGGRVVKLGELGKYVSIEVRR